MTATERALPVKTIVGYALGSLGTGGFATLPGLVLVFYLTDTLGVTALLAGVLVTAAKIWDVLIDPVIGARSDRALARHGSRRGFMRAGALLLPVFFVLTFAVPAGLEPAASGLWVLVAFMLTATAFSLFQVPYIALPAELADGYDQRTRLLTWRVVVLTAAILLFGAGGPMLRRLGGENEYLGYLIMAVVAGVVIGGGMLLASRVAPRGVGAHAAASGGHPGGGIREHYKAGLAVLRRSQSFRALLLTFMLQGLATGVMLAGANYVAVWVLHSEAALELLFVALIAPALFCAPLWGVIARRVGKERGFVLASVLFGVAALSLTAMLWAPGAWVYLPVALAGAGYAGMQSLPMAMLPDVISHDAAEHGDGQAGTFSGVWTAGETTGMALGATALTLMLAATGYIESVGATAVEQSDAAVMGIVLSFSALPAALIAVSLLSLRRYTLRKSDIDRKVLV
ncbi:MFS transporter [Microterricola viridarii]|uniref:Na+/melibiose symporter n=1 Tax=Microterricola viridarii TaxID=412690 RepID=A0A1H1RRR4_9MICO|nr:MFS transporter [Microterricola viridarii]SDS38390.1 Na+/melibiose symporter [Microterricola viridarii]